MNLKDYPPDWKAISIEVRQRAGDQCECEGECGTHAGERCAAVNYALGHRRVATGQWKPFAAGRDEEEWSKPSLVVLTVAHLWQGPCADHHAAGVKCGDPSHLKAMCQACHLRYDLAHHIARRKQNRFAKKAVGDLFAADGITLLGLWGGVSFASVLVKILGKIQRPALPVYGAAAPAARWPGYSFAACYPEGA